MLPTPACVVLTQPGSVLDTHSGGKLSDGLTLLSLRVVRCSVGEMNQAVRANRSAGKYRKRTASKSYTNSGTWGGISFPGEGGVVAWVI